MESEKYPNFEDLGPPSMDIKEIVVFLFSENWEDNFKSVSQLRSFIKFNWEEFKYYWIYLKPRLFQLTSSLRSTLAKISFMFISDILREKRSEFEVSEIFSMLLSRSSVEKSFIKTEVLNGLENLCNNYPSYENCEIALNFSFGKSAGIVSNSIRLLEKILNLLESHEKFSLLMKLAQGKRQEHSRIAKKLLNELEQTSENFKETIENLDKKSLNWIKSLKGKSNSQNVSLKEMIKLQKENLSPNNFE